MHQLDCIKLWLGFRIFIKFHRISLTDFKIIVLKSTNESLIYYYSISDFIWRFCSIFRQFRAILYAASKSVYLFEVRRQLTASKSNM